MLILIMDYSAKKQWKTSQFSWAQSDVYKFLLQSNQQSKTQTLHLLSEITKKISKSLQLRGAELQMFDSS